MHREERDFSIVLHVAAEFGDDYDGDEDGFAWFESFERELKPRLVAAVFDVLRSDPRFATVAAPRGRDPERALEIAVTRVFG
ncbi:MAG: hypothetical protein DIU78_012550 [Pseudomonadota bacterium]